MQASLMMIFSNTLKASGKKFLIPVYQRNYSWNETQCESLMEDILRIYNGEYNKHFIGSIIYKVEDGDSSKANVIDGQQRLSTMFLLCKAIYDFYDDEETKREMKDILFDRWSNEPRLLPVESDNEVYLDILNDRQSFILRKENKMYQNYLFFMQYLENNNLDIRKLIQSLEQLEVIIMELHERDNPQVIFESINSTGLSLSNADLIRNYLLLGESYDDQLHLYRNYWFKFEKSLGFDNMNSFFEHYLNIKILNKSISRNDMYIHFKDYVIRNRYTSKEIFENIDEYVSVYMYLVDSENVYVLESPEQTKKLNRLLNELNILNAGVSRMFIMEVLCNHKKGNISDEDLIYTVEVVVSYILRRSVCNYGTNSLQKVFRHLYSQIQKNLDEIPYRESFIHNFITTKANTKGKFPSDVEFKDVLSTRNLYGKFRYLRYLLFSLENYGKKTFISDEDISIEHVMPQTLTSYWKNILGDNYKNIHADLVDDIGNLTLTSYNSELSNRDFETKLNMLKDESNFKLNRYFENITEWNKEEIEKRSIELAQKAIDIWKFPEVNEEIKNQIESSKYKIITMKELIENYETCSFKSMKIEDDFIVDISSFRDLCYNSLKYSYMKNPEKILNNFVDNQEYTRSANDETFYLFSKDENKVRVARLEENSQIYFDINRTGWYLLFYSCKLLEINGIDLEEVELTVYNN